MLKQVACLVILGTTLFFANGQPAPKGEVIYHLFQRSFYDSNGDGQGDLNGVRQKLDYLQDLGVTSILLLPLYESLYYHNYFATDFQKIDPEFGTMDDYIRLAREVHRRGMKLYMDMEMQYVTEDQLWWKDSYGNPKSKYSSYILYNDSANLKPEKIIFDLGELPGYDGTTRKVATANLYSEQLQGYTFKVFKYFVDPNNDGRFDDGVDGFRLDHMMDDLDFKGRLTNLFSRFWSPMLKKLRDINPAISITAEQAVWGSYGKDYFEKGNVDRVFAFQLQAAIASFDKIKIAKVADTTFNMISAKGQQVVFIENHDMQRFASLVDKNEGKERVGAALNLLIGGVPSIYYGQELGMFGQGGFGKFGMTDANDIPRREAFEWYKDEQGKGMAIWYKNTGPWWDSTNLKAGDGVSLEEEKSNPNSLFNFYRNLIRLRQSHPALVNGAYLTLDNTNQKVFSFLRKGNTSICVIVNLSGETQATTVRLGTTAKDVLQLMGKEKAMMSSNRLSVNVPAYGIEVWELK